MEAIRGIADHANAYFDREEPWKTIKEDPEKARVVLSSILNVFRDIAIYLKPVLPEYSKKVSKLFNEDEYSFDSLDKTLKDVGINAYEHLAKRVDLTGTPFEEL
jgi:methionyl-tRNA synthetase